TDSDNLLTVNKPSMKEGKMKGKRKKVNNEVAEWTGAATVAQIYGNLMMEEEKREKKSRPTPIDLNLLCEIEDTIRRMTIRRLKLNNVVIDDVAVSHGTLTCIDGVKELVLDRVEGDDDLFRRWLLTNKFTSIRATGCPFEIADVFGGTFMRKMCENVRNIDEETTMELVVDTSRANADMGSFYAVDRVMAVMPLFRTLQLHALILKNNRMLAIIIRRMVMMEDAGRFQCCVEGTIKRTHVKAVKSLLGKHRIAIKLQDDGKGATMRSVVKADMCARFTLDEYSDNIYLLEAVFE
ncbi:hypothetical protein PFISCL1PPCAC_27841, partial [Pristionchus fissidentatus]